MYYLLFVFDSIKVMSKSIVRCYDPFRILVYCTWFLDIESSDFGKLRSRFW